MPVKRRRPKLRHARPSPVVWAILNDAPMPAGAESEFSGERLVLDHPRQREHADSELGQLWRRHAAEVVKRWAVTAPGNRPSLWWCFDAPRTPAGAHPGFWYDGLLPAPRRRLGGIGTPRHEVLAHHPLHRLGIPVEWVTALDVETFGRGRRFAGVPIDPDDPPAYESQAAYLRRHGLLLPGEERRLTAADFEPEAVPVPADDDEGSE